MHVFFNSANEGELQLFVSFYQKKLFKRRRSHWSHWRCIDNVEKIKKIQQTYKIFLRFPTERPWFWFWLMLLLLKTLFSSILTQQVKIVSIPVRIRMNCIADGDGRIVDSTLCMHGILLEPCVINSIKMKIPTTATTSIDGMDILSIIFVALTVLLAALSLFARI